MSRLQWIAAYAPLKSNPIDAEKYYSYVLSMARTLNDERRIAVRKPVIGVPLEFSGYRNELVYPLSIERKPKILIRLHIFTG